MDDEQVPGGNRPDLPKLVPKPPQHLDRALLAVLAARADPGQATCVDREAPQRRLTRERPDVGVERAGIRVEHDEVQPPDLGARVVGGNALQNSRHGGTVNPGAGDRKVEDAVYTDGPFTDTSEVITGFYLVETDDEDTARRVAALVPTGGHIEWRKVFPTGA